MEIRIVTVVGASGTLGSDDRPGPPRKRGPGQGHGPGDQQPHQTRIPRGDGFCGGRPQWTPLRYSGP